MAKLGHGPSLDLADALTSQVEVFTDLFESAGFTAIEAEAELENFALAFVERTEKSIDLFGQQCRCRNFER